MQIRNFPYMTLPDWAIPVDENEKYNLNFDKLELIFPIKKLMKKK